jgi:hypothetical protein
MNNSFLLCFLRRNKNKFHVFFVTKTSPFCLLCNQTSKFVSSLIDCCDEALNNSSRNFKSPASSKNKNFHYLHLSSNEHTCHFITGANGLLCVQVSYICPYTRVEICEIIADREFTCLFRQTFNTAKPSINPSFSLQNLVNASKFDTFIDCESWNRSYTIFLWFYWFADSCWLTLKAMKMQ